MLIRLLLKQLEDGAGREEESGKQRAAGGKQPESDGKYEIGTSGGLVVGVGGGEEQIGMQGGEKR